jgi:hypothetical protein
MKQNQATIDNLRAVLTDPMAPPAKRILASENLIAFGLIDETESILETYRDSPEFGVDARKALAMCRYLRESGIVDDLTRWRFDHHATGGESCWSGAQGEVSRLIHRVEGATRLIVVFTGGAERFWVSIDLLHQFLRRQGHQLLYLRDIKQLAYLGGIPDFGPDLVSSYEGIRGLAEELGAAHISCLGTSVGGYGALLYGIELGADRVLVFNGTTDLSWEGGAWDMGIGGDLADKLRHRLPPELAVDLGALYRRHPAPPQVTLYYGALHKQDKEQAMRFQDVRGARLVELEGHARHTVIPALLAQGRLGGILAEFAPAARTAAA